MLHRKHITISLIFVFSLLVSIWILQISIPSAQGVTQADYHPSINIDGNAELDAFCSGNGTSGNITHPYVIENLEIKSDGAQNGFKLSNTNRYLIIRNVNISEFYQSSNSIGIFLNNCVYVTIDDCHFYNNSIGMQFENVTNSHIIDSSGSINRYNGINFENCHNNTLYNTVVFENGLKENEENGMNLISSNNNTIEYCLFIENWGHGLYLQDSFYNVVFDTQFILNHKDCFFIFNDPEGTNQFYDNTCRKRSIPGAPIGLIVGLSISTIVILVLITRKKMN